ncbi:hypothetical protein HY358_01680 [Candidatus Roizmanbacteria bacterium]|nr:hypothetical protein [Candidatus Roizmanbacteria bacterium]
MISVFFILQLFLVLILLFLGVYNLLYYREMIKVKDYLGFGPPPIAKTLNKITSALALIMSAFYLTYLLILFVIP